MKKMSRALALVAAFGTVAAFATGCSASGTGGGSTAGTQYDVAFVVGAASDPFFQAMKVGADKEAKDLGVKLQFQGDATTYSPSTQIPIVNQALATSPNALIIGPTDPTALQPVVDRAAATMPVVNVDTSVGNLDKVLSFITGDNEDGGAKAADAIAKGIGYQDGKSYTVAVGLSSATSTTNVARLTGFEAQLKKKYPGITVVATAYSESNPAKANTNVNNWLTAYPDLAGIFAIDGTNATGAAAALQAKGLVGKVALVGYDAYKANVDLLKQGVFTALIAQDPAQMGKLAVQAVVEKLKNSDAKVKHQQTLPNIILDKNTSADDLAKYTYVESAG
ncbi:MULTISPECIES: substrate-binding domain-containing protein [unclassified Microbacterium]|uniref:substrate-binding domain-containing protein n=1 Tax=unclassified Microbacterium TaxID=2609290 RepID=UPI00365BF44D